MYWQMVHPFHALRFGAFAELLWQVETGEPKMTVFYASDLDTREFGSGFPVLISSFLVVSGAVLICGSGLRCQGRPP